MAGDCYGRPKLPQGTPNALQPQIMRNIDDVSKGLAGFVSLRDTMVNEDLSGEFQRRNEPLSYYWRAVKSALPLPLRVRDSLQSGFWPSSTFGPALED
jgi:hypothetical protein